MVALGVAVVAAVAVGVLLLVVATSSSETLVLDLEHGARLDQHLVVREAVAELLGRRAVRVAADDLVVDDGAVALEDGEITALGATADVLSANPADALHDARGDPGAIATSIHRDGEIRLGPRGLLLPVRPMLDFG